MKDHILTVVLVSVMAILSLPADDHWTKTEPGGPHLASISPSDNQAVMLPADETTTSDANFHSSPVMFVENAGQWDDDARFQVWGGPAGTMWLAEDAIWITMLEPGETSRLGTIPEGQGDKEFDPRLRWPFGDQEDPAPSNGVNIKLSFVGANPHSHIETFDRLDTTVSYFYGNDPDQWQPDVPVWGGVRYVDLYPGIDLELMGEDGQVALRLTAKTGADLSAVRLRVEGADGVELDEGSLRLNASADVISWPLLSAPGSYDKASLQTHGEQGVEIDAPFAVAASPSRATRVAFDDSDDMLYGTFLGGSYGEFGAAIAVDEAGSVFVAGDTYSIDFPTTPGAFDTTGGYTDGFVAKLDPTGSALVYATYLGGGGSDRGTAIAVDQAGSAYAIGSTGSSDFPVTPGAFDVTHGGGVCGPPYHPVTCHDAFVTRLDPTGSALVYSTFLGSQGYDFGTDIDVDHEGSAYVIIGSGPNDRHVTPDTYDTCPGDSFIAKLNPDGSALAYCTFFGGSPMAIVVDRSGSAYVTGVTGFSDIPVTPGAFDTSHNPGDDAFVARLHPSGNALVYATYLGGSGNDGGYSIAVDPAGSAYIAGHTVSSDFPVTSTAFDTSYNGNYDGDLFVAKLNPAGSALDYATYLGGIYGDFGGSIAVDGSGRAFVSGSTTSSDFPTTPNAFDTSFNNSNIPYLSDVFLAGFNQTGSALIYGTFLGGNEADYSSFDNGIALDKRGDVYVTGTTSSDDFPTTAGAFDTDRNSQDAFVVKLAWATHRYLPMVLVD